MLGTHPASHTGGHHLGCFHDCTSHRQHCHSERSQLYQEELLDCHASETLLEIDLHLNIINSPMTGSEKRIHFHISKYWNSEMNVSFLWAIYNCPTHSPLSSPLPAITFPHKETRERKHTINTNPMNVPTTIPAMAGGTRSVWRERYRYQYTSQPNFHGDC